MIQAHLLEGFINIGCGFEKLLGEHVDVALPDIMRHLVLSRLAMLHLPFMWWWLTERFNSGSHQMHWSFNSTEAAGRASPSQPLQRMQKREPQHLNVLKPSWGSVIYVPMQESVWVL